MTANTKIEWADATFNPWIGCTKVSPGCDNCYAAQQDSFRKWTSAGWGAGQPRKRTKTWGDPVKWDKEPFYECASCGWRGGENESKACEFGHDYPHRHCPNPSCHTTEALLPARRRVFCASLADVFDNEVDPLWRTDLWNLIEITPRLDWLLLTKRIGNARGMYPARWSDSFADGVPPNLWLGATIVNQEEADRDIPKLLEVPARVRFLSMEPLLGAADLRKWLDPWTCADCEFHGCENDCGPDGCEKCGERDAFTTNSNLCKSCGADDQAAKPSCPQCGSHRSFERDNGFKFDSERKLIDWVIVGGESGPKARPMHPDWARSLRDQCKAAGVPFLFKQWGEWHPQSSANYATAPNTYRYGKVEGLSMMPSGAICLHNAADAPAGRATIVDAEAMQGWHDRCRRAEGKPDAENYPFDYQWLHRVGKKAAGRLLDGTTHDAFPEVSV
jgi:protein gp37